MLKKIRWITKYISSHACRYRHIIMCHFVIQCVDSNIYQPEVCKRAASMHNMCYTGYLNIIGLLITIFIQPNLKMKNFFSFFFTFFFSLLGNWNFANRDIIYASWCSRQIKNTYQNKDVQNSPNFPSMQLGLAIAQF